MELRLVATALAALAALASHAAAQPATSGAPAGAVDYVMLGNAAQSSRLERLLDVAGTRTRSYRRSDVGGFGYVGCLTAWRGNEQQTDACMRSRLPASSRASTIVLSAREGEGGQRQTTLSCIGAGGSGRTVLRARQDWRDAARLRQCIERGLRQAGGSAERMPRHFGVRHAVDFEVEDVGQARSSAVQVLLIAIDHVGTPRGNRDRATSRAGSCDPSAAPRRPPMTSSNWECRAPHCPAGPAAAE